MTRGDIIEELESHIRQRVADNLARGMSMADATREARRRFGSLDRAAASCARVERRRQSPWRGWRHDVRAAATALRRSPAITAIGVVVVTAGVSVTLAVTLVADALLFSPPPGVRAAHDLRLVMNSMDGTHPSFVPYETCVAMADVVRDATVFCRGSGRVQVVAGDVAGVRSAEFVTSQYFDGLGARFAAGRAFSSAEERDRVPLTVLSHAMARALFRSAETAVGQSIAVNGQRMAVVGVAEPGFRGQMGADPADLWLPVPVETLIAAPNVLPDGRTVRGLVDGGMGWLTGVVRLSPGQTAEAMSDRFTPVVRGDRPVRPDQRALLFDRAWLTPFSGDRDRITAVMRPLGSAVALVLMLAAACLSSLFLGRLVSRRHELVVRGTLGASRGRLMRLIVAECLGVVVLGSLAALPIAGALLALVGRLQIASGIRIADVATTIDGRAAALAAIGGAVVAVVALPGPLLYLRRLTGMTAHGGRLIAGGGRARRALMAAEVALGCALLAGAGLLTRSIAALERRPLGFDASQIGYLELEPGRSGLRAEEQRALVDRLRADASGDPTLAAADFPPFGGNDSRIVLPVDGARERPVAVPAVRVLGPYFDVLGIPIVAGEAFSTHQPGERVAVISESLAQSFWPNQPAVGRQIRMGGPNGPAYRVIGVAAAVRDVSLRADSFGRLYLPLDGDLDGLAIMRRSPQPGVAAGALVQQYRERDSRLIAVRSGTVGDLVRRSLDQRVMLRMLTAIVGVGSLVIVGVGVWGLAHSTVTRRWREFGLRLALGAERHDVVRLAMTDAAIVTVLGGGAGLLLAWQFGRALESWLFGVRAWDPLALAAALALVAAAVVAGNSLPARQAGRLDPATLLRHE